KATVKSLLPASVAELGAQAVLANAYHLYLQPGPDVVERAGGLGSFMNWPGPTFTDSGGFQVMSLGVGFKKVLAMNVDGRQADDVIFAFDECTTLMNTRGYQERSVARTHAWAQRCLAEHRRLTAERPGRPYQALFAVVQGAQYEDLRRKATQDLLAWADNGTGFDGFGIGGALEKE